MVNIEERIVGPTRQRADATPFVRVKAIRKAFGGTPALQGIGFDVPLGNTVSLLGP